MSLQKIPESDSGNVRIIPKNGKLRPHLPQLPGVARPVQVIFADVDRNPCSLNNPQAVANDRQWGMFQAVRLTSHTID